MILKSRFPPDSIKVDAACNLWLKEIRQVLVYPEQVSIPVTSKKQLLYDLMQIKSTEQIVGLNEVIELIMHIKEIPDPIS